MTTKEAADMIHRHAVGVMAMFLFIAGEFTPAAICFCYYRYEATQIDGDESG